MNSSQVDRVFCGFQVATMLAGETEYGILPSHSVGVLNGKVAWVLPDGEVGQFSGVERVEGRGRLLTPGLIDCHTHLVYGGNRANEWESRLNGASYESISKAGGGILSTVRATRNETVGQLVASAKKRLASLIAEGVTTVEIKSGYGLNTETELKMLEAAGRLGWESRIRVESTLLAAHAVPPEFTGRADDYLDLVCQEMIPSAKNQCTAVDAFCESIAFDVEQTKRVLRMGLEYGLQVKVHAEQLSDMGMAAEAARMGAISADHLEYLSEADCEVLAAAGTVATLLPGAFYCLKETQRPPIAALRSNAVPIAIATDSNPGSSPLVSLLLAGNLACNLFGLTPEESFAGMTRNAAQALGLQAELGTIEVGKQADFAIWKVSSPAELLYQMGGARCDSSYRSGRLLFGAQDD